MPENAVVIVAAGRGERLGISGGPKQYRRIGGKAVLQHTIECFVSHANIDLVQVVIHADDHDLYMDAVLPHEKLAPPVIGGATRQASCCAGVEALATHKPEKVLIHDAARPFVSAEVITNVLEGISANIGSLPAVAVADTLKRAEHSGMVRETIPRDLLHLAQTPQGFLWQEIFHAHKNALDAGKLEFTDDAAVGEWAGMQIKLVNGDRENFKITTAQDLAAAEAKLAGSTMIPDVRTGSGYDVHTLGPNGGGPDEGVILGGITIPHNQSLQGHSDADVVLHALTDALMGTIGAGDIGSHFPPSDPKWKGVSSDRFLAHAVELVTQHGGTITNLDTTIVCEEPKIGPHRDTMRERIAEIAGIIPARVSVKATTNEKVGFIGRGEGIAALATATVVFQG